MTPARLRTFLAMVDAGTAKAAAADLSVTESAVSASLAALQREVGAALFERSGRGLRLTEAGTLFTGYARRILGLIDEGLAAARSGGIGARGRLRLGAVTTAGEYLVPTLLASFRRRYPDVDVALDVGPRDRILARLSDHQLDVAIAGRPLPGLGLVSRATRSNTLIVVAAPGADTDLGRATWLLREPGSGTRATTLGLLDALQLDPPVLTLGSPGSAVASAVLGLGVTVTSADAIATRLSAGELEQVSVPGTPLRRPWHLVTTGSPTATTQLFLGHVTGSGAGPMAFRRRRAGLPTGPKRATG
ncbi:MAG: LysR substrate-binding domain-containing protein [Jatrophihabitans sp.]